MAALFSVSMSTLIFCVEAENEAYEVIETPGARQDLVTQLITMDLSERPATQQIAIGGLAGW